MPALQTFRTGPFVSTRTTTDVMDFDPTLLVDGTNVYAPDPRQASSYYARPGFGLSNNGSPLTTSATTFRGQGGFPHVALDGTVTNYAVFNGKLFRADTSFLTWTDVSPVGITIDNAVTTRVFGTSLADQLVVTDGVNRPWLATNLTATPITGTYIDFDGIGTAWTAYGPFTVYGGSVFCILATVNGVSARVDIAWSAPGQAGVGYQQPNYDYRWTLEQQSANQLFALFGTNVALLYWRAASVGSIVGPVSDLVAQHTSDQISINVGTEAPQSIIAFGTTIYFTDAIGRPYRLIPGADPDPIWKQMRGIVDLTTIGFPAVTRKVTTAALEPTRNLYIVAIWSGTPSSNLPSVEGYIFDAQTGKYFSRFVVGPGIQLETLVTYLDAESRATFAVLGSLIAPVNGAPATSGYVWTMNTVGGDGDVLATEDGTTLTTEDSVLLTTEGVGPAIWQDNGVVPTISVQTDRLGYDADTIVVPDRVTALVESTAPVSVSVMTAADALTLIGTPTPSTTQDGVSKLTVGVAGLAGRGAQVTLSPTTATTQWSVQMIELSAMVQQATPADV